MPSRCPDRGPRHSPQHAFTPPKRSAQHGFTLVEVMVALLIFGMLAAGGIAILSFSVRAQAATGARLDELAGLERTAAIMAADLGQAVIRATRDENGTLLPAMVGDATTLRLVRGGWTNIDGAARPSEQKLAYALSDGRWQRVAWPMLDGAVPLDPAALVDGVAAVRLRYRYRGAWSDRWDGALGVPLPDAVEMSLLRTDRRLYRQMFLVGTGWSPAAPLPTPTATPDAPR